jgi:hypothetical protein
MPSIIISNNEFASLSVNSRTEILNLIQKKFTISNTTSNTSTPSSTINEWYKKREAAYNNRACGGSYIEFSNLIKELEAEAPNVFKIDGSIIFSTLSIEMALAMISGLSDSSQKILLRLIKGPASREELGKLVSGIGRVNGSIGSINRRFANRFDRNIYGETRKEIKLIDFDNVYKLVCDSLSISTAFKIIEAGWKRELGDIFIEFKKNKASDENSIITIHAQAVKLATYSKGFIKNVYWDYEYENGMQNTTHQVALSFYSATLHVENTNNAEAEWAIDHQNNTFLGFWHEISKISFQNDFIDFQNRKK